MVMLIPDANRFELDSTMRWVHGGDGMEPPRDRSEKGYPSYRRAQGLPCGLRAAVAAAGALAMWSFAASSRVALYSPVAIASKRKANSANHESGYCLRIEIDLRL